LRHAPASPADAALPCAPAACHLGGKRLEPRRPHPAESPEPDVEFGQRRGLAGVDPAGAVRPNEAKPLSRSTLRCWDTAGWVMPNSRWITSATCPDGASPSASSSRDAPAHRVAQHVEGMHHEVPV
jgi:hypothetical protein